MSGPAADAAEGRARLPLIRFALLVLLLAGGWALLRWTAIGDLVAEGALVARLDALASSPWFLPAALALWVLGPPLGFPASPILAAVSVVSGVFWGTVWNFTGAMGGAAATYFLGRALGRDLVVRLLGERRVARVEGLLERHGFWHLARIRLLPLPFVLVNYGAALAGYSAGRFLAASALGMAPSTLVYTYFFARVVRGAAEARPALLRDLALALVLLLALSFVPVLFRRRGRDDEPRGPEPPPPGGGRS